MTNKVFTILLSMIVVSIIGCAGNCNTNNKLSGTLYVTGNEPFTFLSLSSNDGTIYRIECSDSLNKELWKLQGSIVVLDYNEILKFEKFSKAIVTGFASKELDIKEK